MIDPVTRTIMETSGDYQYMRDDWTLPTELPSLQDAKGNHKKKYFNNRYPS